MEMKFKGYKFVYNEYVHEGDGKGITAFDKQDILDTKGVSRAFIVRNFFGDYTEVEFTITNVEIDEYNNAIYTIVSDINVPESQFATPSDILEHRGYVYPISYSRIRN